MKNFTLFLVLFLLSFLAGAQTTPPASNANDPEVVSVTLQGNRQDTLTRTSEDSKLSYVLRDTIQRVGVNFQNLSLVPMDSTIKFQVFVTPPNSIFAAQLEKTYDSELAVAATRHFPVGSVAAFAERGTYKITVLVLVYNRATKKDDTYARQFLVTNQAPGKPLPVTLTSFAADAAGSGVNVQWATATEVNAAHFVVERSANGVEFTTVTQVAAKGASTYNVLDLLPYSTGTYYRLRSVDADNTFAFSKVVFVRSPHGAKGEVLVASFDGNSLYPVRAQHGAIATRYVVRDAQGRIISTQAATGRVEQALPTQGVYFLTLEGASGVVGTTRMVIR